MRGHVLGVFFVLWAAAAVGLYARRRPSEGASSAHASSCFRGRMSTLVVSRPGTFALAAPDDDALLPRAGHSRCREHGS